jgi:DNA-directed RNA polymerase specialized sigma24 family protein
MVSDLTTQLPRLIAIDVALASPEGLHIPTFARDNGIGEKTVHRLLRAWGDIGQEHSLERLPDGSYVHRYLPSIGRLFLRDSLERQQRGRKALQSPPAAVARALSLIESSDISAAQAAAEAGVSVRTVYRWLPRGAKSKR